jgi:hypothetical protein
MWLFIREDFVIKMWFNNTCDKSEQASNLMMHFLFEGVMRYQQCRISKFQPKTQEI